MMKTIKSYPPLHPKRLQHPLERTLREEWMLSENKLDLLAGPTQEKLPIGIDFDCCSLTGGFIPYPYGRMTPRDKMVAAEIIQWLGTGVGLNFLVRAFTKAGGTVDFDDYSKGHKNTKVRNSQ